MATKEQEAFEAYFRATWPEPSDGIMYCRPQMERDFKAGWDAAQAPLLEIMQEASDFLKSIEGAGYGGISRYDVLCVRLEEAMKGSTGKPPLLEVVKQAHEALEAVMEDWTEQEDDPRIEKLLSAKKARASIAALRPFLLSEVFKVTEAGKPGGDYTATVTASRGEDGVVTVHGIEYEEPESEVKDAQPIHP